MEIYLSVMQQFMEAFALLAKRINSNAHEKGFYDGKGKTFGDDIALMHSELSEALEGYREGDPPSDKIPEFSSIEEELADTIIRIADMSREMGLRVGEATIAKVLYNETRPYRHGGKKL